MSQQPDAQPGSQTQAFGWHLFETSPDCVKLLSADGRVRAMNRNGLCTMEIDAFANIADALWKSFWPPEHQDEVEAAIAAAVQGGTGHFTAFCPTAKGTPKWWDVVVTRIASPDEQDGSLLAVSRDITAARQAQSDLQASEARFRSLAMATNTIVWTTPASGRFETPQPAWEAFTGQTFEQYRGNGWLDAVHPDDRATTLAAWEQAFASRSSCQTDHRLRRADGDYCWMGVKAVPVFDDTENLVEWVGAHTDITGARKADVEREQLLREVQAANDRMRDIFQQAPAFMCVLRGPDHVFEMINDRYLQLVGNRNPVGQPVREALPEIAGQGFFELLDRVYRTGEPFFGVDMPVMLQRHPGAPLEQRFIDQAYTALRDADGRVTGLLVHGIDQTHRKLAEIGLHESRERFEKIVSQAATGVVEMDTSGTITFVNQKYAAMLGYTTHELVGRNVIEVTAPDSVQKTLDTVNRIFIDGIEAVIDKHYLRKDGSFMPATSSVNAIRGPDGEVQGVVAIVLDTTEEKRAAEELRASEERYRTLFESVDQGFCIIDIVWNGAGSAVDYRFIEMNAMFERHTGLVNATGKTARELVPGLDQFWIDTYGRVATTGEAVRFEDEAPAMGRWFDVYATRIGGAGSNRVAVLFSDITARKQADDKLRKLAADLAEADRRKTEFLATLAHELRNPLAPIRSGLGVLRMSAGNPAAIAKVRDIMERQVGHMVHLIDDLLDIARISSGKLELKKTRADLGTVMSSAIETVLPAIEAGKHRLDVDLPHDTLVAEVDVVRIAQVVGNLLSNAAKYTPTGGRIGVTLRREGQDAVIAVSDTGVGIPADALGDVFEMFSQIGRNMAWSQSGLGIGLSLVRRVVEMHGGSVVADSAGIDAGSTFTVRLPLARMPEQQAGRDDEHPPGADGRSGGGIDVLVVDDNVDAAVTLSMLLELNGHTTRLAHDGIEAIEVLKEFRPRLAFVDIGMPRMDGCETARTIRQVPELQGMFLVAVTGWGADDDRKRSRDAGFDQHLTKPVQLDDVERILRAVQEPASSSK
jgi:PAS domain S-box-containing protein